MKTKTSYIIIAMLAMTIIALSILLAMNLNKSVKSQADVYCGEEACLDTPHISLKVGDKDVDLQQYPVFKDRDEAVRSFVASYGKQLKKFQEENDLNDLSPQTIHSYKNAVQPYVAAGEPCDDEEFCELLFNMINTYEATDSNKAAADAVNKLEKSNGKNQRDDALLMAVFENIPFNHPDTDDNNLWFYDYVHKNIIK